ncbi:MAG: hypothetical protein LBV12_05800 [Puniceicoccales bacterium]|nr:hypothetical protein [Puniceicoccales bacterium]
MSRSVGWIIFNCMRKRTRSLLSNLHHSFPEKSEEWRRSIALESCRRMVEMGLFVVASPFFSEKRIRKMFQPHESLSQGPSRIDEPGVPGIILVPHFSLMETLTQVRVIFPELSKDIEVGVFYRPFKNRELERWVKNTRERFGLRLLSRKAGFGEALAILRKQGRVAVLFDQNAGHPGTLTFFMERVASTSELAGLLAERHQASAIAFYTERTAFWKGVLKSELISNVPDAQTVTIAANVWLENKLKENDNFCADWLWMHKRWKTQDNVSVRFRLEQKRNILSEMAAVLKWPEFPRRTRFWIRMPDALCDAILAIPLIRALQKGRPDGEITLLLNAQCAPVFALLGIAGKIITLPEPGSGYWQFFKQLSNEYPDTYILLADSPQADREAELCMAVQCFGMVRNRRRSCLTHGWKIPKGVDEQRLHKTRLWERWWQEYGLREPLGFETVRLKMPNPAMQTIGLVFRNGKVSRWPKEHWRTLILQLAAESSATIRLLVPGGDKAAVDSLLEGLPDGIAEVFFGKTGIGDFSNALADCSSVVSDDLHAIHLANLLGIPVVGLLEEKDFMSKGPVFDSPAVVLQASSQAPWEKIDPSQVVDALRGITR